MVPGTWPATLMINSSPKPDSEGPVTSVWRLSCPRPDDLDLVPHVCPRRSQRRAGMSGPIRLLLASGKDEPLRSALTKPPTVRGRVRSGRYRLSDIAQSLPWPAGHPRSARRRNTSTAPPARSLTGSRANVVQTCRRKCLPLAARTAMTPDVFSNSYPPLPLAAGRSGGFEPRRPRQFSSSTSRHFQTCVSGSSSGSAKTNPRGVATA